MATIRARDAVSLLCVSAFAIAVATSSEKSATAARGQADPAWSLDAARSGPVPARLAAYGSLGTDEMADHAAVAFAKRGADVAVSCLSDREGEDAQHTAELVQKTGRRCPIIRGDISTGEHAVAAVETTVRELGGWTC